MYKTITKISDGKQLQVLDKDLDKIKNNPQTKGLYRFPKEGKTPPEVQNINRPVGNANKETAVKDPGVKDGGPAHKAEEKTN